MEPTEEKTGEVMTTAIKSQREYSKRSLILKAYETGHMPIDHQRLLAAIKQELGDGVQEGIIQL